MVTWMMGDGYAARRVWAAQPLPPVREITRYGELKFQFRPGGKVRGMTPMYHHK